MKLQFLGAAQTVTGSKTLFTFGNKKYLIDCGLFQGPKEKRLLNWKVFEGAKDIDGIFLTHAHLDHSGYIPKLVKEGFRGPIYCSKGTFELAQILLQDAGRLQEEDARFANETQYSSHQPALPLYDENDAIKSFQFFKGLDRDHWYSVDSKVDLRLLRSGHIIGSSFTQLSFELENAVKILTFSGDLGNGRIQTLKGPVSVQESDFLVLEGTYGDRTQTKTDPSPRLAEVINEVHSRNGVLIIPAFSVGRTQEILFLIRKLEAENKIPKQPVYLDSPMANRATEVFIKFPEDHSPFLLENRLESPFTASHYTPVRSPDESMLLCMKNGPLIVVSAAGMLTGGRVMHHLKHRLGDERNGVLFVGYQAEGTKGRLLQEGLQSLRIHHEEVSVEATIYSMDSLSAHADADDIMEWLKGFKRLPSVIFLNHGEEKSLRALQQRIENQFPSKVIIPSPNSVYNLRDFAS